MLNRSRPRHAQSGVMLLEVLIALLIFALGVLGLVGLQANAIKQSGQAKYRADATLLANELIGQMWLSGRTFAILQAGFSSAGTGGAQYNAWKARVAAALPGADSQPPTVALQAIPRLPTLVAGVETPSTLPPGTRVTITMRWKAPGEPTGDPHHSLVLVNEIN
ncbi:type IV pilus modification protein PilV [Pelomonas sp. UHG3]|uniref:Type IV pilus modification protein PilV n=1 Tax=Roseateles hydrophilus TaxID=2975054 RepID=A0ACC6CB53_9BURK|nr:type IV pilus modification protein PilV [Pelomonas sp. UHG3]MCY4745622.1 type IV pilus modification protein PilV [Pelomonas sp. UHG3]